MSSSIQSAIPSASEIYSKTPSTTPSSATIGNASMVSSSKNSINSDVYSNADSSSCYSGYDAASAAPTPYDDKSYNNYYK